MAIVAVVATSCTRLPRGARSTGIAAAQLGMVHRSLTRAGVNMALISPAGGPVPVDAGSVSEEWAIALELARDSQPLSAVQGDIYTAYILLGGHGALVDLAQDREFARVLGGAVSAGRPIAAIDHGAAALAQLRGADGLPIIAGARVTGRSDSEERAIHHHRLGVSTTERLLRVSGAHYSAGPNWSPYTVADGLLITAQNTSSVQLAMSLLLHGSEKLKVA